MTASWCCVVDIGGDQCSGAVSGGDAPVTRAVNGCRPWLGRALGCGTLDPRPTAPCRMDFRILGPLEVLDEGQRGRARRQQAARAARAAAAARQRDAQHRPADRRAVGRAAARHRRQDAPGARLAPAQGARRRGRRRGRRGGHPRRTATSSSSTPSSSTRTASSGWSAEGTERARGRPPRAARSRRSRRRSRCGAARRSPTSPTSRSRSAEIARLDDLRVAALEQLIEAKLALGRHAEVIGQLEALIAEHPYRERLRGPADARALPLRPPGRRAPGLPGRQADARRGARHRAGRAPARARAGDPRAGPGAASPACRPTPRGRRGRGRRAARHGRAAHRGGHLPAHGHRGLVRRCGRPIRTRWRRRSSSTTS